MSQSQLDDVVAAIVHIIEHHDMATKSVLFEQLPKVLDELVTRFAGSENTDTAMDALSPKSPKSPIVVSSTNVRKVNHPLYSCKH